MKPVMSIIKWEYLNRVKSKLFLFSAIVVPVLIAGSMILPSLLIQKDTTESTPMGIVDIQSGLGQAFVDQLETDHVLPTGNPAFPVITFQSVEEAQQALWDKTIDGYVVLDDSTMERGGMFYARNTSNFKIHGAIQQSLNHLVIDQRLAQYNLDPDLVKKVTQRVPLNVYEIDRSGVTSESNELMEFMVPFIMMMLLYMTILISGQILMRSVIEERSSRMIEILLSTVKPGELLRGKIFGLGGVGLTMLFVYLLMGYAVSVSRGMSVITPGLALIILLFFTTGFIFYAAIFATIGSLVDSEQDAQQIVAMISIMMVVPIMLASYFITNPSATGTIIATFIPPITPFLIALRAGTETLAGWEIIVAFVLMILSIWGILLASGRIFRTAILLYGKRITFPEIWRWIRSG